MIKFLFLFLFVTSVQAAAPTPSFTSSRTSCVAPCAVFFDATGTTDADYTQGTGTGYLVNGAVAQNGTTIGVDTGSGTILTGDYISIAGDSNHYLVASGVAAAGNLTIASPGIIPAAGIADNAAVTVQPNPNRFHSLRYRWSFGDPNAGKWSYGANTRQTKNQATGPVAAHVYETAGTYVVTMQVYDGTSTVQSTDTITVTDISGANTYCISADSVPVAGVGGCPASATGAQQSNFATIISTYALTGKAVLLKRGDTFTSSASGTLTQAGPGKIGMYGSGNNPIISVTGASNDVITFSSGTGDWRIMDLTLNATGTTTARIVSPGATAATQITVLRVTGTGFRVCFRNVLLTITPDQFAVVDSNCTAPSGVSSEYGVYCEDCTNVFLAGNYFNLTADSGNMGMRMQGVNKLIITNNTSVGSFDSGPLSIRGATRYGVVSDNVFTANMSIVPQNTTSNETQRDVIVERNKLSAVASITGILSIASNQITIRNNLFITTGAATESAVNMGYVNTVGSAMVTKIDIYNNTVYSSSSGSVGFKFADYAATLTSACNSNIKNNIVYAPNATSPAFLSNSGSCVVTGANGTMGNSSTAQISSTSPSFASATPSNPEDFRIAANSYAYTSPGSAVPVTQTQDFYNCKAIDGTIYRGALVPKANMQCWGAR